jgi:hypothetical protein
MADHAWVLENVAAYLTDGLTPAERQDFEQHTAGCPDCAAALESARRLDSSLGSLFASARPSPALEDHLIQSLRTQQAGRRLPFLSWPLAAAALVLLGLTGAVVSHSLSFPPERGLHSYGFSGQTKQSSGSVNDLASSWSERILSQLGGEWSSVERARDEARSARQAAEQARQEAQRVEKDLNKEAESPLGADWGEGPAIKDGTSNTADDSHSGADKKSDPKTKTEAGEKMDKEDPVECAPPPPGNGIDPGKGMGMMGMMGGGLGMMGALGGGFTPTSGHPPPADYFKPSHLFQTADSGKGKGHDKSGEKADRGDQNSDDDGLKGPGKSNDAGKEKGGKDVNKTGPQAAADEPAGSRKIIIRSGDIEFEVDSFDPALATITLLVHKIRGGFVATVNSEKLANGKVRGSIVVRVPPEHLDELVLQLRKELGKTGELKTQRISSEDITKKYTDLESRLRAARAMEDRLLQIIKSGKGEIKDLLAAEKELGVWRTRIEEVEGELRYYRSLVSLSTLTIILYEKEIRAPYAVLETERVTMSLEVEEVDEALRAAQKAVLDAKGRITRSELKQHAKGQYSARLDFEVAPDSAGPVRDRLKQLGTVAQLDIDRVEESEGGTGKLRDGKVKRSDSRFVVSMYNLTTVAPRETVLVGVACTDPEAVFKSLLAAVEKANGRILSSSVTSPKPNQAEGSLQFEVKPAVADALLAQIKQSGEVMQLQVAENPATQDSTRKKRGFNVQLVSFSAVTARETEAIKVATRDVRAAYRSLQEAVRKAKGRVLRSHLDEKNPQDVQARLDFEVRRTEEEAVSAALAAAGDVYTRNISRAQDAVNVVDSKVRYQLTLINQDAIPPRETHVLGLEVGDVDQTAATISALVAERQGRTQESQVSRKQDGEVTGRLVVVVPLAKAPELIDRLKAAGVMRVQQASRRTDVPDSPLATARLEVTLSTRSLLRVSAGESFWEKIRDGLSRSMQALAWSLMFVIIGVCFVLPWAIILYGVYRLVVRLRGPTPPAAPAAPAA